MGNLFVNIVNKIKIQAETLCYKYQLIIPNIKKVFSYGVNICRFMYYAYGVNIVHIMHME